MLIFNDSFTGHTILGWKLQPLRIWKVSLHCLLAPIAFTEESVVSGSTSFIAFRILLEVLQFYDNISKCEALLFNIAWYSLHFISYILYFYSLFFIFSIFLPLFQTFQVSLLIYLCDPQCSVHLCFIQCLTHLMGFEITLGYNNPLIGF